MNARQTKFVQEYLIDLNATQAAIRAGYSKKAARAIGSENLTKPDIATAIDAALFRRAQEMGLSAERVLGRLSYLSVKGEVLGQISAAARCEELLGKHVGMWPNRLEHSGPNGGPIEMLTASISVDIKDLKPKQRDQLRAILLAAKGKEGGNG